MLLVDKRRSEDSWFFRESAGNGTHVELLLALIVAVFEVFFGLFRLIGLLCFGGFRFTGEPFFQGNTDGTAVSFKSFLRPAIERL